jgi:hypothetical protein
MVLGIAVAGFCGVSLVAAIAVGKAVTRVKRPTPIDDEMNSTIFHSHRCHFCDERINIEDAWTRKPCPNCTDFSWFHTTCADVLQQKEPHCNGVSMAHASGHTISLKYKNICARCGLAKLHWEDNNCEEAAQLQKVNIREMENQAETIIRRAAPVEFRKQFTMDDALWLSSIRVSLVEGKDYAVEAYRRGH